MSATRGPLRLTLTSVFLSGWCGCAALSGQRAIEQLAIDAALGSPEAKSALAVEFYRGERVERDLAKAANLWRQVADAGDVAAHNNLGYLTYHGLGVARDRVEGVRLWRFAAERGHAEAQFHLGYAFSDEEFPQQDSIEALAWAMTGLHHARASEQSVPRGGGRELAAMAQDLVAKLSKRLTGRERREAEARSMEYIARYGAPEP